MERFFQILAVILVGVAAYFLLNRNIDGTFVAGVLGAVSFFLSIRFQVKGRLDQREAERLAGEAAEREEDEEILDSLDPANEMLHSRQLIREELTKDKEV